MHNQVTVEWKSGVAHGRRVEMKCTDAIANWRPEGTRLLYFKHTHTTRQIQVHERITCPIDRGAA